MSPNSHSTETLTWLMALLNCCSTGVKLAPLKDPLKGVSSNTNRSHLENYRNEELSVGQRRLP